MKRLSPYLAFFLPFCVYAMTACPAVAFFDSGEMVTAAFTLGSAHPPGYPVYVMLSHLFTYLPLGNMAFKTAIFSGFAGGMACFITFHTAREVYRNEQERDFAALASALTFAFTSTFWGQAVYAKFYCLSTAVICLCIYLVLRYVNEEKRQYLYAACFVSGIAICTHFTAAVLFPVIIAAVLMKERELLADMKVVATGVCFVLFGMGTLLYLPFRAWQLNAIAWGDPQNLTGLLWILLRKGYISEPPDRTVSLFLQQMRSFNLYREFGIVPLFMVIFGFFSSFRKVIVFSVITLIVLLILNVGVVLYGNPPEENIFLLESFHTPGYLVLSLFSGFAVIEIARLLGRTAVMNKAVLIGILLLLPALLVAKNYRQNDWSDYYVAQDYAKNVLNSCERDSVLFTWGDSGAFPLWYLQYVEKFRNDVTLIHVPHIDAYWYWNDKLHLIDKMKLYSMWQGNRNNEGMVRYLVSYLDGRRVKIQFDYSTRYSLTLPGLLSTPAGIIYRYTQEPVLAETESIKYFHMRGLKNFEALKDLDTEKALAIYGYGFYDLGMNLIGYGKVKEGREIVRMATDVMPSLREQAAGVLGGGSQ